MNNIILKSGKEQSYTSLVLSVIFLTLLCWNERSAQAQLINKFIGFNDSRSIVGFAGAGPEEAHVTLPFSFEKNKGQAKSKVEFLARYGQVQVSLTSEAVIFHLPHVVSPVKMRFVGANQTAIIMGEEPLDILSSYFVGTDPAGWSSNVPHYGKVRYREIYPGIDLLLYNRDGLLEYDFIISPGADPDQIHMEFTGVNGTLLDEDNQVVLDVEGGSIIQKIPATYQDIHGQRLTVGARQFLDDTGHLRFELASYQQEHALIIDPVMSFSHFFGGSGEEEIKLTTGPDGYIYITGNSSSPDLPITDGSLFYPEEMFDVDGYRLAFVGKLDPTGSQLLYMTFLGGSKLSTGHGIQVDTAGNVYVTGRTEADDFPLVNPLQLHFAGGSDDIFLSKLDPDGSSLVYSTYIGGSDYEFARSMALDSSGNVYLTGGTTSRDFPLVNPIIPKYASVDGEQDIFVTKINPEGSRIVYSTYIGGSKNDLGHEVVVGKNGNAYVTGLSNSPDFPTTTGAFQTTFRGGDGDDVIIVNINPSGSQFVYSTFIGGTDDDESRGIAVDATGNTVITGYTRSRDYPIMNPLQPRFSGGTHDIIVTSLNAQGTDIRFSTYIGGSGNDYGRGIALDRAGNIYLTGYTTSDSDFPLQQPLQKQFGGGPSDAFIIKLDSVANQLLYSSFHGGSAHERGRDITVDAFENILVSGFTESRDFPVTLHSSEFGGGSDEAFIIKLAPE